MEIQLIWTIIYGAICGYVASRILGGDGFGFLGNIVIGILGGLIGHKVFDWLDFNIQNKILSNLVSSVAGAIILIIILEWLQASTKKKR
ncbi:MAG: GlsB/YeaQ/YmgE family stress response membrane protein [Saprospiraceae bacterium]|nr:GlsB/YeaQ/YmgE family stress response membrane protein [Saprospiraceae bacterium]MBK7221123.1 GlsB/YeaQ/YmgE family stress response membrane protein [Saprospiraceae bacterium]MBK7789917.1 GlsB/YeaQ/YmgE family stress response membrane protein [Saprospiraceae bacterium]MBK8110269.1 GlsB/YeaQ/YmgE family stress response membrane protein [Saprospiraceae bacterium]MBK8850797.1 GlsB/YeaQ/YmgE family stress response membrane protein [Saprospiraceae bacterium]